MTDKYRVVGCTKKRFKVVATKKITKGELIAHLQGIKQNHPTQTSIYCDGIHIDPDNGLQFLNHSCNPNAEFQDRRLVCISNIR